MISSMTGMGRAETNFGKVRLTAEARSVNHKYLDVTVRLPNALSFREDEIRQLIRQHVRRGYVQLYVGIEEPTATAALALDHVLVRDYQRLSSELRRRHRVTGRLDVNTLLSFPGVIKPERASLDEAKLWQAASATVDKALARLVRMRRAEGRNLAADLRTRLRRIARDLAAIKRRAPLRRDERLAGLRRTLARLAVEGLDRARTWEDVASQLDRMDIEEECVRLVNHLHLFERALNERTASGRKLSFILQELLKETNTISAKAFDTAIAHRVVRIKDEIESLREQVQNIE